MSLKATAVEKRLREKSEKSKRKINIFTLFTLTLHALEEFTRTRERARKTRNDRRRPAEHEGDDRGPLSHTEPGRTACQCESAPSFLVPKPLPTARTEKTILFIYFIYLFQFYLFICLILERMARGEGSEASAAGLLSSPDEGPIGDVKVSTGGPVGILIRLFLILFFCSTKRIVR